MMRSLKGRLFAILLVSTGIVWLSAVAWIYVSTRAEVERVLDARLMEAARMVSSLIDSQDIDVTVASLDAADAAARPQDPYQRQLSCQIWSLSGSLIGRSDGAPTERLSDTVAGFSERVVSGETWRVYTVANAALGVQVMVGDNLDIRAGLVRDVVKGLVLPMALVVPALGALLWFGVGRGMRPLDRLAAGLEAREASDLHPLPTSETASEIRPVVTALNGLFQRVAETRERERHFLAYAAHELRTPLAGLKTQAEISLKTDRDDVRAASLTQIMTAVDRTSRLVRQLLDTAEAESAAALGHVASISLSTFLKDAVADQVARAKARDVRVEFDATLAGVRVAANEHLLSLAFRNLVENAINYSPEKATVRVRLSPGSEIVVEDEGPGMLPEEICKATERFFRGTGRSPIGSGLGLSIAQFCADRLGAKLVLQNRMPRGFAASIRFGGHAVEAG